MDSRDYNDAIAMCPSPRIAFPYFEDRYALSLLEYVFDDGTPLRHIKQSPYASLLKHGACVSASAECGTGKLSHNALLGAWPTDYEVFWLTLGKWDRDYNDRGYSQTSRPGGNIVLQLSFSSRHDRAYRRMLRPHDEDHPFVYTGHPIAKNGLTLAWARIDVEPCTGEALIEEIQSDWIAFARRAPQQTLFPIAGAACQPLLHGWIDPRVTRADITRYLDRVLWRYERVWAEAMLAATLWLLHEQLGIRTIYFHTPESSRVFKAPVQRDPPRSLYTQLPRRFCFQRTQDQPQMLRDCDHPLVQYLIEHHAQPWHVLRM